MFLVPFLAIFISVHFPTNGAPARWSFNYCLPGEHGPTGWARTKTMLDNDWKQYVRSIQNDNCDYILREVRGNLNL